LVSAVSIDKGVVNFTVNDPLSNEPVIYPYHEVVKYVGYGDVPGVYGVRRPISIEVTEPENEGDTININVPD
jgi:hypothetical protein